MPARVFLAGIGMSIEGNGSPRRLSPTVAYGRTSAVCAFGAGKNLLFSSALLFPMVERMTA